MTSSPAIRINSSSAIPPFEQVRQQITNLIRLGVLTEGQRLPPVRQLAADLGLANGTVARAYQELEAAGLVVTRRAAGTRVASAAVLPPDARTEALILRAREFVIAGRLLGAGDDELTKALAAALRASNTEGRGPQESTDFLP
ncbi:DNA-binding transcriptional regulator YhcF, GntR family [Micromonospora viridifaciens]|uniref:DNA-binding transcriptional regulator YhcF, GntR family n=1 Tax=Micromonospora viridifaciens TaxID=1881 RepID=A0A1C4X6K6_MICVI|nr:GntR family transcriptional regulator [Micromonospora viridifaciens]SCF04040.1 DNA-binding transcriptional regulator YhcF, GntR family [Micromonospora viridifaciens]